MSNSGAVQKSADAFRTISEVADALDLPQHVLRFWETRFAQIKPLKRGGGRRFYRPEDVELLSAIRRLLYGEGYTIRGVQRILKEQGPRAVAALAQGGGKQPGSSPADPAALDDEDDGWFPNGSTGDGQAPDVRGVVCDLSLSSGHHEGEARPGLSHRDEDQAPRFPVETPMPSGLRTEGWRPEQSMSADDDLYGLRAILTELEHCKRILLAAQS